MEQWDLIIHQAFGRVGMVTMSFLYPWTHPKCVLRLVRHQEKKHQWIRGTSPVCLSECSTLEYTEALVQKNGNTGQPKCNNMYIVKLAALCSHWCPLFFDGYHSNLGILEIKIAVKWDLWVGEKRSWKGTTVLISSQRMICFHFSSDGPIFSLPQCHFLNRAAASSLISNAYVISY